MSTLKDVAHMAGVSVSTVSYVLNGKKKVRKETQKRIEDAIEALDYRPNLLASSLKTNRSQTVGIVVSDMRNIFFGDVLASIERELAGYGYCGIICNADNSAAREQECLVRLTSRNIDGLILIGTGENDYTELGKLGIPVVCIDRAFGGSLYTIGNDNILGGYLGTMHLIRRGYRNILFMGYSRLNFSKERQEGYRKALREAGRKGKEQVCDLPSLDPGDACRELERLLKQGRNFDAVFGCTDYIAIGALKALKKENIAVPQEVGVMGYDDIAPAGFTTPELTTVAQPKDELGEKSVQCLMKLIRQEEAEEKMTLLCPSVVVRESC